MISDEFILWLNGYIKTCGEVLTTEQILIVREQMDKIRLRGPFRIQMEMIKAQETQGQ